MQCSISTFCLLSSNLSVTWCFVGEISSAHQYCLALVRGEKEMEVALQEGKYPVIDVLTDVFAIPSAPGEL